MQADTIGLVIVGTGFGVSALASLILARWPVFQSNYAALLGAPQHVHEGDIPRMGGLAVLLALLVSLSVLERSAGGVPALAWMLVCVAPTFALGMLEDVRGDISPAWRYLVCAVSALWAALAYEVSIPRYDFAAFDALILWPGVAVLLSVFCVAGVTQAFNIIDGKNGLSSGMAWLAVFTMSEIAAGVGDVDYLRLAQCCLGAVLGFWWINTTAGKVFLGDAGAYLVGFLVAIFAVSLVQRNAQISPWAPFVIAIYPITETLFTMVRRIGFERNRFSDPDYLHMHSLLYSWLRLRWGQGNAWFESWGNSTTAALLVISSVLPAWLAVRFYNDTLTLKLIVAVYVAAYTYVYLRLRVLGRREAERAS